MPIKIGHRYTAGEIERLLTEEDAHELRLRGYVLRFEPGPPEAHVSVVHWTQADMYAKGGLGVDQQPGTDPGWEKVREGEAIRAAAGRNYVSQKVMEDLHAGIAPHIKRTPQQRIDSLVSKWYGDCRRSGTIPGLSDDQITKILGREWRTGESEITMDDVRRLAAVMLGEAWRKNQVDDEHRVVSTPGVDRTPEIKTA